MQITTQQSRCTRDEWKISGPDEYLSSAFATLYEYTERTTFELSKIGSSMDEISSALEVVTRRRYGFLQIGSHAFE